MRKSIIVQASLAALVLVACVVGCHRGEKLAAVSGTVTFEGEPLTEGVVTFSNPAKGIHMNARLDAQGHYEVRMAKGAGLPPGEYQVSVSPPVPDTPVRMPEFPKIPHKYRDPKTSELSLSLTEDGAILDIDMRP